ncbi:class I SAM-dependent methyltransferase [Streptomyces sp. NPDC051561]|uniref:class I SAM-dependent methyltransferase n=1 Tax=Streptomyces sp. NPDC051561 TaxID=3365658 RepID=UPI00379DC67B
MDPTPTPLTPFQSRAHSFNPAAANYAAHRPSYPPALLDALELLSGRPLATAQVADIGAGTGIATAVLRSRGAHVIAVEPGEGMAAELHRAHPDVPLLRGDGNALPLADASVDLLTYAQAWHWTDPARSVPEALRVLRPGGALALWWNTTATDVPWQHAQAERLRTFFGTDESPTPLAGGHPPSLTQAQDPTRDLTFVRRFIRWSRRVPLDTHLANLATHSAFLVLGPEVTSHFLAEERTHLLALFPAAQLEETYVVDLNVACKPS